MVAEKSVGDGRVGEWRHLYKNWFSIPGGGCSVMRIFDEYRTLNTVCNDAITQYIC